MMEKTINSLTIVSLIAVLASLTVCMLVPGTMIPLLVCCGLTLAGTLFNYFPQADFESMFAFMVVLIFAFGGQLAVAAFGVTELKIPMRTLLLLTVINYFIPVLFSIIMALSKRETERNLFAQFFTNCLIMLGVAYVLVVVYWVFFFNVSYNEESLGLQLIPFATIAGYLDAVIKGIIEARVFLMYFVFSMVIFIPFGFLMNALLYDMHVSIRVISLLGLPIIVEVLQLVFSKNTCDFDDVIFGFLGGAIGMLLFRLLDMLFVARTGRGCTGNVRL